MSESTHCVSKLDAFFANVMVSSFKEGQAEKDTFCWSLSGVGIRRGGQQGLEVRGPGCGRDACPLPEMGAWGERWRGMARELSSLEVPAVTEVCLGLCLRTTGSPGMAEKRQWFHSSGSCLRWRSGCGLGWQGGGAGASRRGGEVQAGTGREGAGVDRAA